MCTIFLFFFCIFYCRPRIDTYDRTQGLFNPDKTLPALADVSFVATQTDLFGELMKNLFRGDKEGHWPTAIEGWFATLRDAKTTKAQDARYVDQIKVSHVHASLRASLIERAASCCVLMAAAVQACW